MLGKAVAISISPTLNAEPVRRKIKIDAASEVSALPMVDTSWPVHIKVKLRLRKTANGEGEDTAERVVMNYLSARQVSCQTAGPPRPKEAIAADVKAHRYLRSAVQLFQFVDQIGNHIKAALPESRR